MGAGFARSLPQREAHSLPPLTLPRPPPFTPSPLNHSLTRFVARGADARALDPLRGEEHAVVPCAWREQQLRVPRQRRDVGAEVGYALHLQRIQVMVVEYGSQQQIAQL